MTFRPILLVVTLLCGVLAGAIAAKLHSRLAWSRSQQTKCFDVPCSHFTARMAAIESHIGQIGSGSTYLALGDSFVELAMLPTVCGRRPINAGIGWSTTETLETVARRLTKLANPDFVVISVGTNDALQGLLDRFQRGVMTLQATLSDWPIIFMPVPHGAGVKDAEKFNSILLAMGVPVARTLSSLRTLDDGIHLTPETYAAWNQSIIDAASATVCR